MKLYTVDLQNWSSRLFLSHALGWFVLVAMCFDFRLEMPFSSQGFNWCFLLWPGLGAAGLRESFAPLPLESWACFGLGLLSSVQRCWWGLVAAWGSFFLFNCGYAKFLSIMGLGSEKMAPNHDYTFNAHYLVLLQHWESCCLLGGIRRFV